MNGESDPADRPPEPPEHPDPESTDRPDPEPPARPDPQSADRPDAEHGPDTASARGGPEYVCDICGSAMLERHCKILCPTCGYQRDCSDP